MEQLAVLAGIILILLAYFIPVIIAYRRKTQNAYPVLVINFFLGWTFLGWVISLAMAAGGKKEVNY